ncbi:uncharacterized protein LOC114791120 isoform X2 [Denticeps clupeoides]|uniref:uncharacterized protein LOC114791120 isoform X2 n=1 Tax=Denticeps clupeoides TaxID=299321 RepID=UPI0010A56778|nr:uncharacterized protein LOC114791120 isoform X2 [Denticeps clupeoides]
MNWQEGLQGDEILKINRMDVWDKTPEQVKEYMESGSVILRMKQKKPKDSKSIHFVSEEKTMLSFCLDLSEVDCMPMDNVEVDEDLDKESPLDVLMPHAMINRNFDFTFPCTHQTDETDSSTVCRDVHFNFSFSRECRAIDSQTNNEYKFIGPKDTLGKTSAHITIFHYDSVNKGCFIGSPVALKFTKAQTFLKCTKEEGKDKVKVQSESCEESRLKNKINKGDEDIMPFVFYMKQHLDSTCSFESAMYSKFFICAQKKRLHLNNQWDDKDEAFYFRIRK